jgi:4-amino-4-deoxy-L-arabinose transferase-like glycosyltransferase
MIVEPMATTAKQTDSASSSSGSPPSSRDWTSGPAIVAYLALGTLALHLAVAGRYDFFRDELYYIACSKHLALGYVDQPPLIALVVWLTRHLLGASLWALRAPAALAGAALVWLTGRITRELGGGRFAQVLAATSVVVAPIYIVMSYLMTMNAFSPLFWMGCALILIRILKTGNQQSDPDPTVAGDRHVLAEASGRLWVWFGVLAGLGLENKYGIAVFGLAVVVGLLATREWRQFRSDWLWIGGLIALLIILPNLVWQTANGWPFLQLMHNIRASGRDLWPGTFGFFLQQFILMNVFALPVWVAGLWFFFRTDEGRVYRALGWAFVVVYLVFFVLHGKDYYLSPAYPMMFAAGAIVVERLFARPAGVWLRPVSIGVLAAAGALFAPVVLPLLPVPALARYVAWLPIKAKATERSHLAAVLPQYFADQFGWREMTAATAAAYWSLPENLRADTAIVGNNYGESAAIDFFGPEYGLPASIGVHQNYWLWGPRKYTGSTLIVLGDNYESLAEKCANVAIGPAYEDPYGLEHEPVLVCYGFRWNLQTDWARFKKWD